MRYDFFSLLLMSVLAVQGVARQATPPQSAGTPEQAFTLVGRWRVKFTLAGVEKNLVFDSQAKGSGSFLLLDAGPDDKSAAAPLPAAWSQTTNARVSFSGEVELPISECCRETGTLILKGKFTSSNSIAGKLIFVTSVDDDESAYKFRTVIGTFTASRVVK